MVQGSTAQINVRLPRPLKESGDAGLRALGLTPSEAVRILWDRLSRRGEEFSSVQSFFFGESRAEDAAPPPFEQSVVAEGWRLVDSGIDKLGLKEMRNSERASACEQSSSVEQAESDGDLVALALEERMQARGLM